MRVKELIEELQKMPENNIVLFYKSDDQFYPVLGLCKGFNELDGYVVLDNEIDDDD